jgi:hypothetical protein
VIHEIATMDMEKVGGVCTDFPGGVFEGENEPKKVASPEPVAG